MASIHHTKWPMTLKSLKDLEKELRCNKCFKPVIVPKTFQTCLHSFCKTCITHITCPKCGVPSSAKEIYHDKFIENVAAYVMNIEKSLTSLLGENTVKPGGLHSRRNYSDILSKTVGNEKNTDLSLEEQVHGSPTELGTANGVKTIKGSKRKRDRCRKVTLSERSSIGSLKKISGDLLDCQNPLDDTHPELFKTSTSTDVRKASRGADLDTSVTLTERNVPIATSTGVSKSVSEGGSLVREVKKAKVLNLSLITPEKKLIGSCAFQIKNVSDTVKKAANKRNAKGETPLQVACKKGNLNEVQTLIANGANPNVKDNFGWTPLHEAIHYKHIEIAKALIKEGGAWVNTPGGDNFTPLHKAVALNVIEGIKLLMECGANSKLVDVYGNTPFDYSQSADVTRTLESNSADLTKCSVLGPISEDYEVEEERAIFFGDGISKKDLKLLGKLSALIPGSRVSHSLVSDVTHVVVNANNGTCFGSVNVLSGILTGKHFVSLEWVQHSIAIKSIKHQHSPVVKSTVSCSSVKGILKARMCLRKQLPSIFSGMHFAISSACRNLNYDNLKKDDIAHLVALGSGHYHSREPDPEAIPLREKTVPFYANNFVAELTGLDKDHPLKNCSHVILYHQGDSKSLSQRGDQSFLKYNMAHFKSLPVTWFVGCIESFTLLDPTPFI